MCDHTRNCTSCDAGVVTLECRTCDGTGDYLGTCINCEGTGKYYKEAQVCFQCNGTGKIINPDHPAQPARGMSASDANIVCPRCQGTGNYRDEVHGICFRCNGQGTFCAPCRKCNATGAFKTQCNVCRGTGRTRTLPSENYRDAQQLPGDNRIHQQRPNRSTDRLRGY